jgi:hypothetical protein
VFDADGRHAAHVAHHAGKAHVVVDGEEGPSYDAIRGLRYAPSGDRLVYAARRGANEGIVLNGVVRQWHDSVEAPVFSSDGSRWGYIAHDSGRSTVVVDEAIVAREESATDLVLSGATRRTAYVARRGDEAAVVDDRGRHAFDLIVTGTLQFLADGSRWVCLAGDDQQRKVRVVVEGLETSRALDWSEIARLLKREPSVQSLREWVAAEGEAMARTPCASGCKRED